MSQGDAEAGIATDERIWTAERVKQAIDALAVAGSGLTFARVVKSADETIQSDIVMSDDADLKFTAQAEKTYAGIIHIDIISASDADFQKLMTMPTNATGTWMTVGDWDASNPNSAGAITAVNSSTSGSRQHLSIFFIIITGDTAGEVNLQWKQTSSRASDTTVFQGGLMVVWEI